MTTRAITILKQERVAFEVVRYKHQERGARYASQAINYPLEKTVKTLVVASEDKNYFLALVPGNGRLSPKKLAGACGVKRVALTDWATAERVTGYKVGGISPIGTRDNLTVIMARNLLEYDKIAINGGQRGIMLIINPIDMRDLIGAILGDIYK